MMRYIQNVCWYEQKRINRIIFWETFPYLFHHITWNGFTGCGVYFWQEHPAVFSLCKLQWLVKKGGCSFPHCHVYYWAFIKFQSLSVIISLEFIPSLVSTWGYITHMYQSVRIQYGEKEREKKTLQSCSFQSFGEWSSGYSMLYSYLTTPGNVGIYSHKIPTSPHDFNKIRTYPILPWKCLKKQICDWIATKLV